MAKFITLIAGNICAGKTNKVQYIEQHQTHFQEFLTQKELLRIVPEYIDPPARKAFYRNRQENSIFFEYSCLVHRIARHLDARGDASEPDDNLYFFDRGIIEAAETFTKNSYEEGCLTISQFNQYKDIIKMGLDSLGKNHQQLWLEQLIVYLEVKDPAILQERYTQRRAQTNEESIPLDYFKRINDQYHHFFENINSIYGSYGVNPPQVLQLDASINGIRNSTYHQKTIDQIIEKMREMKNAPT